MEQLTLHCAPHHEWAALWPCCTTTCSSSSAATESVRWLSKKSSNTCTPTAGVIGPTKTASIFAGGPTLSHAMSPTRSLCCASPPTFMRSTAAPRVLTTLGANGCSLTPKGTTRRRPELRLMAEVGPPPCRWPGKNSRERAVPVAAGHARFAAPWAHRSTDQDWPAVRSPPTLLARTWHEPRTRASRSLGQP